jgi:putative ATP-dependent endonuclease of the OLD family
MNNETSTPSQFIRCLVIKRFRGVENLTWRPSHGLNILLGGGDVGKTTILDAIALLLNPTNTTTISDTDYFDRNSQAGFVIEATMTLPATSGVNQQVKPSWPWAWNGTEARVPVADEEHTATPTDPVYKVRVRGTDELDLLHEIVQPDGTADLFSVGLRRAIGLVRLSVDDRNDRDLRLVQGSALDRLLSDKGLRSRLTNELAKSNVQSELSAEAQKMLAALDVAFQKKSLPHGLDLAITGSQGIAITALIGLRAERHGVQLPLANWGAGTRRLASLTIAEETQGEASITIVDELERGLEPYRQRSLMAKLESGKSQVFATTHSPATLSAASKSSVWYVDHAGCIGPLDQKKISKHRKTDPDAFLARLTLIAEGATELGFVSALLERALAAPLERFGVHVTDGGGHEPTLDLLEALSAGGLRFGGFADNEQGRHSARWQVVDAKVGKLLFRWSSGCTEENFIRAVSDENLEAFVTDPEDEKPGCVCAR